MARLTLDQRRLARHTRIPPSSQAWLHSMHKCKVCGLLAAGTKFDADLDMCHRCRDSMAVDAEPPWGPDADYRGPRGLLFNTQGDVDLKLMELDR